MKQEKIYAVTFREYTNYARDTVYDRIRGDYLSMPKDGLVRESELELFKRFGNGYDTIKCVGELLETTPIYNR